MEIISTNNLDEIIKIPHSLVEEYQKRRRYALVGSYDYIKREFHKMPITEGWATFSVALRKFGAIIAVRYKTAMVNTDIIPQSLTPYVLEHEVIESTLEGDSEVAIKAILALGLDSAVKVSRPKWNHAFAVIHQLRSAQRDGLLDEMMEFADDLESRRGNRNAAFGNKDFREAVRDLLKNA